MANSSDRPERTGNLTNTSRNKRQASMLLSEVARHQKETATRKCAQSDKLMKDCKQTLAKSKTLRNRMAG